MPYRRPPPRLEDIAFLVWLSALNKGMCIPSSAPPFFLSKALDSGSRLREDTLVRVLAAAASSGIENLRVEGEFLNQTLLEKLAETLTFKPNKIEKLSLNLSSKIIDKPSITFLANAFHCTENLKHLKLIGGASDEILFALAISSAPLEFLDLSYSEFVTDAGIEAIVNYKGSSDSNGNLGRSTSDLKHLNIWETRVTTRGCVLSLKHCPNLLSLTSQWTPEALILLEMQESNPLRLEQLLMVEEMLNGNLLSAIANLCPCLKTLTIRRPKDTIIDIVDVTNSLQNLRELLALQFSPRNPMVLDIPYGTSLTYLHLSPITAPSIYLDHLIHACPFLLHLILDGITPTISDASLLCSSNETLEPKMKLQDLKIMTAPISPPLDPEVIMWLLKQIEGLNRLQLGCCKLLQDDHMSSIFKAGCLNEIEDICVSGASNLSNSTIYNLASGCPYLRRFGLKMLEKGRLKELESLKVDLRLQNLLIEIISYDHRF